MSRKNGFTLVEILVSLAVFAVVMAVMASAFFKISKDWQRQRDYGLVLDNARWAMEFMSNEIRQGHSAEFEDVGRPGLQTQSLTAHSFLTFTIDPNSPSGQDRRVYYWIGTSTLAEPYVLYRSEGRKNLKFGTADDSDERIELGRFVVDGTNIFNVSSNCASGVNCTVEMNLTVRPKPGQPIGPGNQNFTFWTLVRPRN
jgi:prepilin-type N-terminal cleavage/methylation domain-containing protein